MDRHLEMEEHHGLVIQNLQADLNESQTRSSDLLRNASAALGHDTSLEQLHSHIKGLVDEGKELHTRHLKTTNDLKAVQEELQNALNHTVELENKIDELKMLHQEANANLAKMTEKEKKSSHLVEELEEQLNSNFDQHQATNHRLSTMQGESAQARIDLERELEDHKFKNGILEVRVAGPNHVMWLLTSRSNKLQHSSGNRSTQVLPSASTATHCRQKLPRLRWLDPDPPILRDCQAFPRLYQRRRLPSHSLPYQIRP